MKVVSSTSWQSLMNLTMNSKIWVTNDEVRFGSTFCKARQERNTSNADIVIRLWYKPGATILQPWWNIYEPKSTTLSSDLLQVYLYDHLGPGFEDVSHDPNRKSFAWRHFLYNRTLDKSKCKHCKYVVKNHQGSTKSLLGHLRNKHQIFVEHTK